MWSRHDSGSITCSGWVGSCSYWHPWWKGRTRSYWHPCNPHETVPCQKDQGEEVKHWLAVDSGSLVQFTGFSFQFQFLHSSICGDWKGASKTVYGCTRPDPNQTRSAQTRIGLVKRLPPGQRGDYGCFHGSRNHGRVADPDRRGLEVTIGILVKIDLL